MTTYCNATNCLYCGAGVSNRLRLHCTREHTHIDATFDPDAPICKDYKARPRYHKPAPIYFLARSPRHSDI